MGGIRWEHDHDGNDAEAKAILAAYVKMLARLHEGAPLPLSFGEVSFADAEARRFADAIEDALEEAASVADYRAARLDRMRLVARELGYFNFLRRRQCNS